MATDLSNRTLGHYRVKNMIGKGGMAVVYRAYNTIEAHEVALKVLPAELADQSPEFAERFRREAKTAAALSHPNIIPIYDYGILDGISFVAMRLLTGGSLDGYLEQRNKDGRGLPSVDEAVVILRQLAAALDYAHSHHVIHRDVKPSNVMFDAAGVAYVVDFGIAKELVDETRLTLPGQQVGTLAFSPPEQLRGDKPTPAVDQYAFGIMAYWLLTGRLPFNANTPAQMVYAHIHTAPEVFSVTRPSLSQAVYRTIARAMAKSPLDRYDSITDFVEAMAGAHLQEEADKTGEFLLPDEPAPPLPVFLLPIASDTMITAQSDIITAVDHPLVDDETDESPAVK